MELTEELRNQFFEYRHEAIYWQKTKDYVLFCSQYPEETRYLNALIRKRKVLKDSINYMKDINENDVFFGALTYDNEHDKLSIPTKRKEAMRHLNKFFEIFLCVEEFGDENGRYHLHYVGLLKLDKTYKEFHDSWHSFAFIERVKSVGKVVTYLCSYMIKQLPKIRRNKALIALDLLYKKKKFYSRHFPSLSEDAYKEIVRMTLAYRETPF